MPDWLGVHSWYDWWSGIGSDFGELTLLAALLSLYWKHSCHVQGCWRIGRFQVKGTHHVTCHRHHPTGAPTHQDVLRDHHTAILAVMNKEADSVEKTRPSSLVGAESLRPGTE